MKDKKKSPSTRREVKEDMAVKVLLQRAKELKAEIHRDNVVNKKKKRDPSLEEVRKSKKIGKF